MVEWENAKVRKYGPQMSEMSRYGMATCLRCNGGGTEITLVIARMNCPRCHGHGEIKCPRCEGNGDA